MQLFSFSHFLASFFRRSQIRLVSLPILALITFLPLSVSAQLTAGSDGGKTIVIPKLDAEVRIDGGA